jgi:hypothetical protein
MSSSAARSSHLALVRPTRTSKSPFLHLRGPGYYLKRKVPADCSELSGGQRELWKSLGTDQLEKAKVMLAVEVTEFDLAVARPRRERAACASGVVPLRRARINVPTVTGSEPGGDAKPASLAHLESIEADPCGIDQSFLSVQDSNLAAATAGATCRLVARAQFLGACP